MDLRHWFTADVRSRFQTTSSRERTETPIKFTKPKSVNLFFNPEEIPRRKKILQSKTLLSVILSNICLHVCN